MTPLHTAVRKIPKPPLSHILAQWFLDCLFPKYCLECGSEGRYWCELCQSKPPQLYPQICFACSKRCDISGICFDCQPRYAFDGVLIASDYDQPIIQALIHNFKYRFISELSFELSLFLRKKIDSFLYVIPDTSLLSTNFFNVTVIPVPLSKKRLRYREFNQAELLANHIVSYCGLVIRTDMLFRSHSTPQVKLTGEARQKNLEGLFYIKQTPPDMVLLVDDVITTGATLHESAKVLKQAGAKEVWVLVVAKG